MSVDFDITDELLVTYLQLSDTRRKWDST